MVFWGDSEKFSRLGKAFDIGSKLPATRKAVLPDSLLRTAKIQQGPISPGQIALFFEEQFKEAAGSSEKFFAAHQAWEDSYFEALQATSVSKARIASMRTGSVIDLTLLPHQQSQEMFSDYMKNIMRLEPLIGRDEFGFGLPGANLPSQNKFRDVFKFLISRRKTLEEGIDEYAAMPYAGVQHPAQILYEKGSFSFNPNKQGIDSLTLSPKSAIPTTSSLRRSFEAAQQTAEYGGAARPFGNLEAGKRILLMDIESTGLQASSDILQIGGVEMTSYAAEDGRVLLRPPQAIEGFNATYKSSELSGLRAVYRGEQMGFAEFMAKIQGQEIGDVVNFGDDFLDSTNSLIEKMMEYDHISGYNINRFDLQKLAYSRSRHVGYGTSEAGKRALELDQQFLARIQSGNYAIDLMDTVMPYIEDQAYSVAYGANISQKVEDVSEKFVRSIYPAEVLADIQTGGTSGYKSMNSLLIHTNLAELIERDGTHAKILYDTLERGSHLGDVDSYLEAFVAHYMQNGDLKIWPQAEQSGQIRTELGEAFRSAVARSRPVTPTTDIADVQHLHQQIYNNILTQTADTDKVVLSVNKGILEKSSGLGGEELNNILGENFSSGILKKQGDNFVISTGQSELPIANDIARKVIRNIVRASKDSPGEYLNQITLPNGFVITTNAATDSIRNLGVTYGQQSAAMEMIDNTINAARVGGQEQSFTIPRTTQIEQTASGARFLDEEGKILREIAGDVQVHPHGDSEWLIRHSDSLMNDTLSVGTDDDLFRALTVTTEMAEPPKVSRLGRLLGRQPGIAFGSATDYTTGQSAEVSKRFSAINDPLYFAPLKNRRIGQVLAEETANVLSLSPSEKMASNVHAQFAKELASQGNFSFKETHLSYLLGGTNAKGEIIPTTKQRAFVPQRILQSAADELIEEGKLTAEEFAKNRSLSVVELEKTIEGVVTPQKFINAVWDVNKVSSEDGQFASQLAEKIFDIFSDEKKLAKSLGFDDNIEAMNLFFREKVGSSIGAQHRQMLALVDSGHKDAAIAHMADFINHNGIVESTLEQTGEEGPVSRILNFFAESGINYEHDVPLTDSVGSSRLLATDMPVGPGVGKAVTYSMPLDEEAVRLAGQSEALSRATETITDKNGTRISRLIEHANAAADRLRTGNRREALRRATRSASRSAPVDYQDPVTPSPTVDRAKSQGWRLLDEEKPINFDKNIQKHLPPIDMDSLINGSGEVGEQHIPMDADAFDQIGDEHIPMDYDSFDQIGEENIPMDSDMFDQIGDDTIPMGSELDSSTHMGRGMADDAVDLIDNHFDQVNPGNNKILRAYESIKPKLGITLAASAIAGAGYYIYNKHKDSQIYQETVETQPFEKQKDYSPKTFQNAQFTRGYSDPLKTAGIVGNLDRGKIGHHKMGQNRYGHLYGGQM